jgi:5-methylcytosine-specific restriction endonuclease McrA
LYTEIDDAHVRREKERARELRKSRWWQSVIGKASCYYCAKALARQDVTMDHVVPISQGGTSTKGNVVPACKACNTLKRDLTAAEWALHLASLEQRPAAGAPASEPQARH